LSSVVLGEIEPDRVQQAGIFRYGPRDQIAAMTQKLTYGARAVIVINGEPAGRTATTPRDLRLATDGA
jgi:hypothetical protein